MIFNRNKSDKSTRKRWYDPPSSLGGYIDKLEHLSENERDSVIVGMKNIIMKHDRDLINRHILEFNNYGRNRWYDADPYTWLIINTLKFANRRLMDEIIAYLERKIG